MDRMGAGTPAGERWNKHGGEFEVWSRADGTAFIVRADPRILVSAQLLEGIADGDFPYASLKGDVLRIEGVNRTVIYRIGEKVPDLFAFYAEWPD